MNFGRACRQPMGVEPNESSSRQECQRVYWFANPWNIKIISCSEHYDFKIISSLIIIQAPTFHSKPQPTPLSSPHTPTSLANHHPAIRDNNTLVFCPSFPVRLLYVVCNIVRRFRSSQTSLSQRPVYHSNHGMLLLPLNRSLHQGCALHSDTATPRIIHTHPRTRLKFRLKNPYDVTVFYREHHKENCIPGYTTSAQQCNEG
jgi:hypothetical protein